MIYHGTYTKEIITIHPMNNKRDYQLIEICKNANEPTFNVMINDGDNLHTWAFALENNSLYELVKHTILNVVFECDTMVELCSIIDDAFIKNFSDYMLLNEDDCNGDCQACQCKN